MGDAVGDDLGLSRSRAGDDEEGPCAVEYGPALGGIEAFEEGPLLRLSSSRGGPGHRPS